MMIIIHCFKFRNCLFFILFIYICYFLIIFFNNFTNFLTILRFFYKRTFSHDLILMIFIFFSFLPHNQKVEFLFTRIYLNLKLSWFFCRTGWTLIVRFSNIFMFTLFSSNLLKKHLSFSKFSLVCLLNQSLFVIKSKKSLEDISKIYKYLIIIK